MAQRNSWVLCPAHRNCAKCQKTLQSYKAKANKHSYNAQRTKYALMCFLEGNTAEHTLLTDCGPNGNELDPNPVPLDEDISFPDTEEGIKEKKENELYMCGVCNEKMVKVGHRKPIIYNCGHSNCAPCFNGWCETKHAEGKTDIPCPYCRTTITKAIRLFV